MRLHRHGDGASASSPARQRREDRHQYRHPPRQRHAQADCRAPRLTVDSSIRTTPERGAMPGETTLLRLLVTGRHWQKFATFEAQFRRAAQELAAQQDEPGLRKVTVSPRQFERWYAGSVKTEPYPDSCRVLEHMFGYPVRQLLGPASQATLRMAPGQPQQDDTSETAARRGAHEISPIAPSRIWSPDAHADSESLGRLSGDSVLSDPERILAMAARRALRFGATADASNVGDESLEQIRAEAARLAYAYPQEPISSIIGDIVSLQDYTFTLLEGRQKPREARDLYFVGGLVSGLVAKATHDLGDSRMAMTHARTALLCAQNAEHGPLTAWIRGLQSLISYWGSAPRDALNYAQLGATIPGLEGTVSIWLASLEARAWSVLGNGAASRQAIENADDLREHVAIDELDKLGGICNFSRARQLYYAADASASLRRLHPAARELSTRAESYAAEAVAAYESAPHGEQSFGDESGARTDLAIVRISGSDLEGAYEALQPVLRLPIPQRIHGIIGSVINVHQAVAAMTPDAPIARDIQEEIEEYCRTPVAALPR